ncbi:uncharacterized protein LOC124267268 [Haliotis rubra]|uniref:uncharacterized protein LOC124267268 n=1 Tax=Haliotis rubra TaxID=36100 RepID=UPI001EE52D10|nr:uncharacterized protein LOC124267268 [Haliotis rubra]
MRLTITCNRTNALLCLAVLASLWTILYFNLSHTNRQAVNRTSMVSQVPIGVVAVAAAVGDKKPADKPAPSGKSDFLLKSELDGAAVFTRSATDWSRDDGTCDGGEHYAKAVLHSVAGDLPISVHPKKIDVIVSRYVIDGRVWEHDQVRRFHDIVKQDGDLQFVDIGGNIGVYGLTMAKLGRTVLFVEPLLINVQKLCNSVRAGKYPDVYVIHNAFCRRPGSRSASERAASCQQNVNGLPSADRVVAVAAAAVGDKKPADKPAPSGKSDFLLKSELRWYVRWGRALREDRASFSSGDLPIFVHPKKMDMIVSRYVIEGSMWEHDQVRRFHDIVKQDDDLQFVDIGGNIGVYGLTMAKLGRTVLFVEPLLINVQKLCNSVRAGKYPDVYVIHNALSSTRFKVGFRTYEGNVGATNVKNATSSGETAQAVLLNDLLEVFKLKKVAIKLDVEAHEAKVLLGGDNFFKSVDVRYVQLEWGRHRKSPSGREIVDFLTRYFMKPYHPATDQLLDTNGYRTWPVDVFWKKTTR